MFTAVLVKSGITPFGEKTFLMFDLKRQYVDYYAYLRTIYSRENSVFYSFNAALGSGTLGFFAYYLSSPFLLILSLFDKSYIPLGITVIIGLKLMLAAYIMDLFLQRFITDVSGLLPTDTGNAATYLGAVSWAFSGFLFAHSMNMMWIDVVMLLPLYIWSLERLLRENRKIPYIVMLFLMLHLNYYITYQVLVFTAFWTIVDLVVRKEKHPFVQIGRLMIAALISALCSAAITVPTFRELMDSPKDVTVVGMKLTGKYLSLLDVLSKLPTMSYDYLEARFGYPQLYCGVLAVFLILLYFACKQIPLREKLGFLALFIVFAVSFGVDIINVIWHAGMEPSGHPYRQAFMCVFLMIICSCRAFFLLGKELSIIKAIASGAVLLVFLVLLKLKNYDHISVLTWRANLGIIAVYTIVLLALTFAYMKRKAVSASLLVLLLLLINIADLSVNAVYTYNLQSLKCETVAEYKEVISRTQDAVKAVKNLEDRNSFYRMENLNPREQNDAFQYNYYGVTQYSSAGLVYVRYFLQRLGFNDDGLYTHYGHDNTMAMDSLLGIKYVLTDGTYNAHPEYELVVDDKEKAYRNPFALSAAISTNGFDVSGICDPDNNNPEPSMEHVPDKDPFMLQEDLYSRLLGKEISLFAPAEVVKSDMYVADGKRSFDYKVRAAKDGELYFYLKGLIGAREGLSVYVNDEFLTTYGNASCVKILNLGNHRAGDELKLTVRAEKEDKDFGTAVFVTEDVAALNAAYSELSVRDCDVLAKPSGSALTVTVPEGADGLFLTIPYESSWKITANGRKTQALAVYDTLTYIPIDKTRDAGEVTIRMKYVCSGLWAGIVLSLIGISLLIYVEITERKKQ